MMIWDSISKYLEYMTNVESSSPHTIRSYENDLAQAFGPYKKDMFKDQTAKSWLQKVRDAQMRWSGLSPASRNRKAAVLKSYFGWLHDKGFINHNIGIQITCPKIPKRIPHFLSVDEAISVLHSFEEQQQDEKLLFLLLYGVGLRVSEACRVHWKDLNLSQRILRIVGKGNKERIVILPQGVADLLKKRKSGFSSLWGEAELDTRKAYDWIRNQGAKAGLIRPLHPHALRHSFATHLLGSGANLRTLQELLGHQSLQATEKYTHLGVDQLARTLELHHPLGETKLK